MTEPQHRPSFADRFVGLAHSRWLLPALLIVETLETSILPLPYEAAFIALCLAARDRIWAIVAVSVLGSTIGGSIVYVIGAQYFDAVVTQVGAQEVAQTYLDRFSDRGASFIFLGGTTPAPSYLINLVAGATGYPYWEFLGVFSFSRLVRFAILGGLLFLFGTQITGAWARLPKGVKRAFTILLIAAIAYWFVSGLSE